MVDFSTISQDPQIRALVQENILERSFHDSLYPRLLFRGEAFPQMWPLNVGDTMVFTGAGLISPQMTPLVPGTDPTPQKFSSEQWTAQIQQYAGAIDTHMPTSIAAIANLFLRNAQQLGLSAAQSLNRITRNRLYNAAVSGQTVTDGAQGPTTTVRVKRLNGFTRARRPDLPAGSPVQYAAVSNNNPLPVTINTGTLSVPVITSANVIGYTSDNSGDEVGTGTVTLDTSVTVADRSWLLSNDRSYLVRVGGGNQVDDIGSNDLLTFSAVRSAVARLWTQNVPEQPDGRFHCHLDPTSQAQIFSDPEFQRVNTSLPDYYMYRQFALGEILNTVFYRNSENPLPETVVGGTTATFSKSDPFAGELWNNGNASTGIRVHRAIFVAQEALFEYYQDLSGLITEAGVTGKIGEPKITNNAIEVFSDRIQLIIRAPLNRLQDEVSTAWKFIGDWPVRTDGATGDAARYKREVTIEHGE